MANITTQSCDVCGVMRKETNHWFRIVVWVAFESPGRISVYPWTFNLYDTIHQHACSDKCVGILVQRWLDMQKEKVK
jgi:hypothetical protein